MSRCVLVGLTGVVLSAGSASPAPAQAVDRTPPRLVRLSVTNGDTPFAGDRRLLATVSPNGDAFRDAAVFRFTLREAATVRLTLSPTGSRSTVATRFYRLGAGRHALVWRPRARREPREYLARLTVTDRAGNTRSYAEPGRAPVIRLQGIDAAFARESYRPGQVARLRIATDADSFRIDLIRAGPEWAPRPPTDVVYGAVVQGPLEIPWRWVSTPHWLRLRLDDLASGVHFARLTASDGRIGYAPFVVRPRRLGENRVAVVLPTQTWQAYNFRDYDGNGRADTWYAGDRNVRLARPHLARGVPHRFNRYDRQFLRFLDQTGREADYLADSDLHAVGSGRELARRYALLVFPGHHEYVTKHEYDVVTRFRDLGGNLIFLSANNFFWKVRRRGQAMARVRRWRELGRPEAALIGVQYFRSDGGLRRRPWVVRKRIPWLYAGTGLARGSRFSSGGIEADRVFPSSPRGTKVVAVIPNLYGPGLSAHMTYYERRGAKVFAAGAFTLAGAIWQEPVLRLVENVWDRLAGDTDTGDSRVGEPRRYEAAEMRGRR